ncbi:MAG: ABC transporter permease subunit [Sphingobacteriales bacterium]|nr:MAG: ABC transporter permease subunit [Sphingobacteriales bacterium]
MKFKWSDLFSLRAQLPKRTHLIIEILGVILLLLLWQLIASLSTTRNQDYSTSELNIYLNTKSADQVQTPRILIYDQPVFNASDLQPIMRDLSANGNPIVLVTSEPNRRLVQTLADSIPGINLIAAMPQGENKKEVIRRLSEFSGSTVIDEQYFTNSETPEITPNSLGSVDVMLLGSDNINLTVRQEWISNSLLPSPIDVIKSYKELYTKDNLMSNTAFSVYLNLSGYLIAILVSIPLGFAIGLFPLFRSLFSRSIDALRFVPLTAVTGLFIAWFGIGTTMKVQFLAFGIFVYLLPVIVQRIDEVDGVYEQTAYTLGANKWQQIRTVFIPSVISRVSDDIRVLVAISWTYIIVAELVNANSGGIGAIAFKSARMSRIDKVFAILLIIVLIGFIQDKLFLLLDRLLLPHKHQTK